MKPGTPEGVLKVSIAEHPHPASGGYRPASDLPLEPEMHPLVQNKHDLVSVGTAIGSVVFRDSHPKGWWFGFLAGFTLLQSLAVSVCYLFYMGVGIWGINVPVAWGFAIVNFVWWIGIGHAGTLI
ncbi:MAG TPA: hypothetical protein VGI99_11475, partial [Gemmataceae bacterium]